RWRNNAGRICQGWSAQAAHGPVRNRALMPGHSVMTVTASIMPLAPAHSTRMMDASTAAGYPSPAASQYTHGQRKTTAAVEETDESLALKTADGDASAFREIVLRHGGRLRAIVFRFSGSGS